MTENLDPSAGRIAADLGGLPVDNILDLELANRQGPIICQTTEVACLAIFVDVIPEDWTRIILPSCSMTCSSSEAVFCPQRLKLGIDDTFDPYIPYRAGSDRCGDAHHGDCDRDRGAHGRDAGVGDDRAAACLARAFFRTRQATALAACSAVTAPSFSSRKSILGAPATIAAR